MKIMIVISISLLLVLSLCGCGADVILESATATPTATPTLTVNPLNTPSPVPLPTPNPNPRIDEVVLNQQIQDFLSKSGDFTQENITDSVIIEGEIDPTTAEIGIIAKESPDITAYFFGYIEKDGNLMLIVGFDGRDGNRFVTLLNYQLYLSNKVDGSFIYKKLVEPYPYGRGEYTEIATGQDNSKEKILEAFDEMKGHFISFTFYTDELPSDYKEQVYNIFAVNDAEKFYSEMINQHDIAMALLGSMADNGLSTDFGDSDAEVKKITSLNEAKNILATEVPILTNDIHYY